MLCPYCNGNELRVTDKRVADEISIRRRRECNKCGKRFTTYERIDFVPLIIIKKDGRKERYDKDKLMGGMVKACEKRPITIEQIGKIINEIERKLRNYKKIEIKSSAIGDLVINKLKKIDKVAYVRFASVYKEFKDVTDFGKEIKKLRGVEKNGEVKKS